MVAVGRRSLSEKGPRGLWAGIGPTCVRALPVNAATFYCYETILTYLNKRLERRKKL